MPSNTFDLLGKIVSETRCKPGWSFELRHDDGTCVLAITINGVDNYAPHRPFMVSHIHPVPHTTFNEASWRRWILEQCLRTMNHELGESLTFGGVRPFAPMHGPGEDPYTIHEIRPERDALTTQSGDIRPGPV